MQRDDLGMPALQCEAMRCDALCKPLAVAKRKYGSGSCIIQPKTRCRSRRQLDALLDDNDQVQIVLVLAQSECVSHVGQCGAGHSGWGGSTESATVSVP